MAARQINVTGLKQACLDPGWRRRWIDGEKPAVEPAGPPGAPPVYGNDFHRVAEEFVTWLTGAHHLEKTGRLKSRDALWHEMWGLTAYHTIRLLLARNEPVEAVYSLGERLKSFCGRLKDLRDRTDGFRSWLDVFLVQEFSIPNVPFESENGTVFVSGRMDAVRTHPQHGLEIVDYKLSMGTNLKHDLLQLAVYARLLTLKRPGLEFHGVLEYYQPGLREVLVSPGELDSIFQEMVEPVLRELAGDKAPVRAVKSVAPAYAPVEIPKPDDLSEKIRACFAAFKLDVEVIGRQEAPQLVRYMVRPTAGVKVVSLANRAEDLQVALALEQPPLIEPAKGCVAIDIPKERPDPVVWRKVAVDPVYVNNVSPVSFPVGVGVKGRLIMADLADANTCHVLVAGTSGSGKSEFLKAVAASLMARNTPRTLKLTIIDPKIITFGGLSDCPFLTEPVVTDTAAAVPSLVKAATEMDRRFKKLAGEGRDKLMSRFEDGLEDMPFWVIIFDEFAELILAGREERKEFESLVARLAAKGRAAGVHLILATQRPDSKVVTGLIKSNLPLKVCFRVTSAGNSHIILDQNGGQSLLGHGDLLCDRGKGIERAQSPYISNDELAALATGR